MRCPRNEESVPEIGSSHRPRVVYCHSLKNCQTPITSLYGKGGRCPSGKVYSVINKRHGKVLQAVGMDEKEKSFLVQAQIPVIESEGFASEIRKTTSGQANPSLRFSHYETIDGDPFFEPVEDEDDNDDDYETKMESGLRANKLRREVRRRKGLQVEDEVVVHAEKQRTKKK